MKVKEHKKCELYDKQSKFKQLVIYAESARCMDAVIPITSTRWS